MTQKSDLIGLGMNSILANVLGVTPVLTSAVGATIGSATQIGGADYLTVFVTGTSGAKLPSVGGDGILIGSPLAIANITAAAIQIYAVNNASGSAVTFYGRGSAIAGTTGVSLGVNQVALLWPVTVSTWIGINASLA